MIRAIVTDIEGTTTALSFVKDVLFPYARAHMGEYLHAHAQDEQVARVLAQVRTEIGGNPSLDELIAQLVQWIDEDRKLTPLKELQGYIWEDGYRRGEFQGHVYEDAVRRLKQWRTGGKRLYIFSSGSVQAQKLLFSNTAYGDLTGLFEGYFDTTVGAKRDPAAYRRISETVDEPPSAIAFLSDIEQELDAARAAGMQTFWVVREGGFQRDAEHPQVRDFDAIELD